MVPAPEMIVGGKYRLERPLAKGGMGSVWVGRHTELDVPVAVKFMAGELVGTPVAETRFKREAKAAAQLRSPNVVSTQDYGVQDGAPYMVMELLEGEDLGALLMRTKRLSIPRIAAIVGQVAKALTMAHAAGIVHRDLKPSNLFLARSGDDEIVKVLDFGVAKDTRSMLVVDKTTSGVLVGSPMYMSPEQARGESLDFRSDLWSLGVVVYEALVGRPPFVSDHLGALLAKIHEARVDAPSSIASDLPASIDAFVARALARRPEDRFPSAKAMADELAAIARPSAANAGKSEEIVRAAPAMTVTSSDPTALTSHDPTALAHDETERGIEPGERVVIGRKDDTLASNEASPVSTTMDQRLEQDDTGSSRRRIVVIGAIAVAALGALALGLRGLGGGETSASAEGMATSGATASAASTAPPGGATVTPAQDTAEPSGSAGAPSASLKAEASETSSVVGVPPPKVSATATARSSVSATTKGSTAPIKTAVTAALSATTAPTVTTAKPVYDPTFGLPSKTP